MAADLDVPLLQHVEEAHLDALRQVGELVDGEDATIETGYQPVVDGELVGQIPALGHPYGIHLTDEIGDRRVRGGQFLAVPVAAVDPRHRQVVSRFGQQILGEAGDRLSGVVVDLGVGHDGEPFVEEPDQRPDDAGLGLATLPQQDDVVPGQKGVLQLRQDAVFEAEHPAHQGLAGGNAAGGVPPDLFGHRHGPPARFPQSTEGGQVRRRGQPQGEVDGESFVGGV